MLSSISETGSGSLSLLEDSGKSITARLAPFGARGCGSRHCRPTYLYGFGRARKCQGPPAEEGMGRDEWRGTLLISVEWGETAFDCCVFLAASYQHDRALLRYWVLVSRKESMCRRKAQGLGPRERRISLRAALYLVGGFTRTVLYSGLTGIGGEVYHFVVSTKRSSL